MEMARDAIGLVGINMEDDNEKLPNPSSIDAAKSGAGNRPFWATQGGYDMGEQYRQLQFRDRLKIEARLNIGYKPKQIAATLGVHVSTIYREMKRGTYTHMNNRYSA